MIRLWTPIGIGLVLAMTSWTSIVSALDGNTATDCVDNLKGLLLDSNHGQVIPINNPNNYSGSFSYTIKVWLVSTDLANGSPAYMNLLHIRGDGGGEVSLRYNPSDKTLEVTNPFIQSTNHPKTSWDPTLWSQGGSATWITFVHDTSDNSMSLFVNGLLDDVQENWGVSTGRANGMFSY